MTVKIMQEVTDWKVPYRPPNHVYLMAGDRVLAMSRWGTEPPQYLANQGRINRGGRRFQEVKDNIWGFDLAVEVTNEPQPQDDTWQVTGSRGDAYTVSLQGGHWACTCPGATFRGSCRHIQSIQAGKHTLTTDAA